MDSWLLEITALSCFMTFICSAGLLVFIVMKEQAWAQTLDWIRDSLNAIQYHAGGVEGKVDAIWKMKEEKAARKRK